MGFSKYVELKEFYNAGKMAKWHKRMYLSGHQSMKLN